MTRKKQIEAIVNILNDVFTIGEVEVYGPADVIANRILDKILPSTKAPDKQEWMDFANFHGYNPSWASEIYEIYLEAGWKKANGAPIKNWKSTMRNRALGDKNAKVKETLETIYKSVI